MNDDFLIKKLSDIALEELYSIGFDKDYAKYVTDKYKGLLFKIYGLTSTQATILKQTALACGTDCATHRDVLTHSIELSDVILFGTKAKIKEIIRK
ncbi:MAG: hypothetical protein MJ180_05905, partial [Candidatus Gastranaerophilales bacterium]|nr:hypothetical protein [Candidatus Gastranaerophilales bacterium]